MAQVQNAEAASGDEEETRTLIRKIMNEVPRQEPDRKAATRGDLQASDGAGGSGRDQPAPESSRAMEAGYEGSLVAGVADDDVPLIKLFGSNEERDAMPTLRDPGQQNAIEDRGVGTETILRKIEQADLSG